MRRTSPDLVGTRKTIYHAVTVVLMVLTIAYVLWTNYVVFVGGNLPLTSIDLGEGSTGGGLAMLFVGDLILVLLVWLLLDGVLLNLLHMALSKGQPRPAASSEPQNAGQGPNAWQGQPQQNAWQGQPQQNAWQGQPQQQPPQWQQNPWPGQPDPNQPHPNQPYPNQPYSGQPYSGQQGQQQGPWIPAPPSRPPSHPAPPTPAPPSSAPGHGAPPPPSGGDSGRLVGPDGSGWQPPDSDSDQFSTRNSSR